MRVLVGRPKGQAEATARSLAQRGHEAVIAPLLAIVPTDMPPPALVPAAILVTSANAVPALAAHLGRFRDVPIHAVGQKTAAALKDSGFTAVTVAQDGHGKALARTVGKTLPRGAALLHAAGIDRNSEPELSLRRAGFDLTIWEAYEARPVPALPDAARIALAEGALDTVLHYSPRSAEILVRLAAEADLTAALRRPVHLCLSRAVAGALDGLGPTRLAVARRPDESALLDLVDRAHVGPIDARARARLKSGARQGTNPPSGISQPAKDDRTPMSETRRDPLRRTPPTIDLKAEEVSAKDAPKGGATPAAGAPSTGTPAKDAAKTGPAGQEAKSGGDPKAPETKAPESKAAEAKPGETKASPAPATGAASGVKPDEKVASPSAGSDASKGSAATSASAAPATSTTPSSVTRPVAGATSSSAPSPTALASATSTPPTSGARPVTGATTASSSPSAASPHPAASAQSPTGTQPATGATAVPSPSGAAKPATTGPTTSSSVAASAASGTAKPAEPAKTESPAKPGEAPKSDTAPKTPDTAGTVSTKAAEATSAAKASGSASTSAAAAASAADAAKPSSATPSAGSTPSTKTGAGSDRSPPPPAAAEPRRAGSGTVMTAGLVGGVLGALLTAGAIHFLPNTGTDDRLAALERRASAPGTLEPRIAALESGLRQAGEDAKAARAAAEAAGKQAAEALRRPAGSTSVAGPDQEARASIQALTGRVDAAAKKGDANTAGLTELGQKFDGLAAKTTDGLAAGTRAIEALNTHVRSLQTDVGTLRTGAVTLDTRTVDAEKRLTTLTEGLGRVSADLARVSPAAIQAGLRVVVAGRLDDAMRSGAPLKPAIAALTKLGTEPALLAPLQPYAEAAPPSAAALAAEFKPLAEAMTVVPPRPDETWLDKGKRLLGKVVTVRAIGDGSGNDVPGLIAKIESALARGAVGEAKAAWDKLPEDKRRLTAAFGERLGGRAAAEDAARRIGAQSLTALDAATR